MSDADIISAPDVRAIYEVPLNFEKDGLGDRVLEKFEITSRRRDLAQWRTLAKKIKRAKKPIKIGIIGKYFGSGNFTLTDSYISVIEALKHAAWRENRKPELTWLDAGAYERSSAKLRELSQFDGIVIPGGFGSRGVEGKIKAIEYVRANKIPFLGLCYGLQLAAVEFARHVAGMPKAHTTEINPNTKYPIVRTMPEQLANIREKRMGGTMRLGSYACELKKGTIAAAAYGTPLVTERHRHRYELNNEYIDRLEKKGFIVSGKNPERGLVEIMELKSHPFFLGTQFHPELKSRPFRPHPIFLAFIKAAASKKNFRGKKN